MANEERDAAIENAKLKGQFEKDVFTLGWNAAVKHRDAQIADELERVRLTTGDMFNEFGDYIKQLRERVGKTTQQ